MGRLRIMGREGDLQLEWSRDDAGSLLEAAQEVEQWLARPGHLAFGFTRLDLEAGAKLTGFDPDAVEIILVPQMRGGVMPWLDRHFQAEAIAQHYAEHLLLEFLTPEQSRDYRRYGLFIVKSQFGRHYRWDD